MLSDLADSSRPAVKRRRTGVVLLGGIAEASNQVMYCVRVRRARTAEMGGARVQVVAAAWCARRGDGARAQWSAV
jgi:hypothetical protein